MKAFRAAVALAALVIVPAATSARVNVLCTTTLVGDVVREVAGADAVVSVLLPPGADPHAIQLSPQDAMAIETADIVFVSGAGLETSLASFLQTARGRVVDLSANLRLRGQGDAADPHVWFDPWNVMEWARGAARALSDADPGAAAAFAERAEEYEGALHALDAWILDRVSTLPLEARRLVTDHESFGYFADRYGFEEIGTVSPGTSTMSEPSARDLAALEDAIRAAGVPAIFVGTTVSATLAERVAADTGARIVFLYTGSLSEADGPAATYVDLMRFDVDRIVAGLSGTT
jgi:manganese/iron transport system substrate-binding protein